MINKLLPKLVKNININLISAFLTCCVLAVIICLLYAFIPQELDLEFIKATFTVSPNLFVAEQAERASYIVSLLLVIPVFSAFYIYLSKKLNINDGISFLNKITDVPTLIIFILLLIVLAVFIYEQEKWLLLLCIIGSYFLYTVKDNKLWYCKKIAFGSIFLAFVFIAKTVYLYLSQDIMASRFAYAHFAGVIYPIFKVAGGLTLNVDFHNIYGNYAYIYLLISKIFGPWNMDKIIYFNVGLLCVLWGLVGFTVYRFTKNKLLFLCIFISFVYFTGGQGQYYLQTNPLRTINFAFIWFWAGLILFGKEKHNKIFIPLGFLINAVGLIWNFESGLISLISYSAFLVYRQALTETVKNKHFYRKSFGYLLGALLTIVSAISVCVLIPYFRTGNVVSVREILWGIDVFYKVGFAMIKISPLHPWFIPLIFYFIALIIALNPVLKLRRIKNPHLPFLFLTALIGLGFYSYYQGRSHFDCLLAVVFPVPIIMGYLIERLKIILRIFARIKQLKPIYKTLRIWNILLCCTLFFTTLFACACGINYEGLKEKFFPASKKEISDEAIKISLWDGHKDFIMRLSGEKDLVMLVIGAPVFYQKIGVKDVYPFTPLDDVNLKSDYDKILDYLETHKSTILFSEYYLETFKKYAPNRMNKILAEREKTMEYPLILFRYKGD